MGRLQALVLRRLAQHGSGLTHFKTTLGFKLLVIAVGVSLIGVVTSSLLVQSLQRQQLIDLAKSTSSRASDLIAISLEHSMMDNGNLSNQIIQAMVGEGIVRRIRILDPQGVVRASSNPSDVGQALSLEASPCRDCHTSAAPPAVHTVISAQAGRSVLLTVSPIHNQPECAKCHDPKVRVLGVSMVEAPLAQLDDQVTASLDRIILSGLATFVLMVGLLVLASRRFVTRPIAELSRGITEVGRGNLDHPVHAQGNDELGELAGAFNRMQQQLQVARAEAAERNRELAGLYQVGTQVSASLELSHVLDAVADGARQVLTADVGWVGLVDQEQKQVSVQACSGTRTPVLKGMSIPLPTDSRESLQLESEQDLASDLPFARAAGLTAAEGIASLLGVPLRRGERVLGMVGVMTREPRRFSPSDVRLLSRLAAQVVVAMENARLYEQVRHLAVLEERDRLAREMHDDLSQALGYMNLKTALTAEQLSRGQIPDAQRSLCELARVIQGAYTDVREAIFSLRTAIPFRTGFSAVLQEYLAEYQAHFGIQARLLADGKVPVEFSEEVTVQVVRIIQEALTNIRKHARANRVTVRVDQEDGRVRISIQDDGRGFDPSAVAGNDGQAFGLQIMRERTKEIGGTLELYSQPGRGTRIVVRVPRSSQT
ncbi:MAG: HAMP domain-containing protein [Chloroflexi bacterium]|nr:HAMP domain-containing protein [Chloroflexota bacterium]